MKNELERPAADRAAMAGAAMLSAIAWRAGGDSATGKAIKLCLECGHWVKSFQGVSQTAIAPKIAASYQRRNLS